MKNPVYICTMLGLIALVGCNDGECNKSATIYVNNYTDCEIGAKVYNSDGMVLDDIIIGSNQVNETFLIIPLQQIPGDFTVRIFGNTEEPCLLAEKLIRKKINTGCSEYDSVDVIE